MAKEFKIGSFAQAVPKATAKKRTAVKKTAAKKTEPKFLIGGARPKISARTTGATNTSSGYLNPNAAGNRNGRMTIVPNVKKNPFKKQPRSK